MIINPLSGEGRDNLFSTHPATQNRIDALMKMAKDFGGYSEGTPSSSQKGPWG